MNGTHTRDIPTCVMALAASLEAMRGSDGYRGPVVHWWRDCLIDCRMSADWRYEGIIQGYLAMYRASADDEWLRRARTAGDDLLGAQREDGHFHRSQFELNPGSRGTPHEAAAAIGLLALARTLRDGRLPDWERYLLGARRVIQAQVDDLWDAGAQAFRDHARTQSFVPNKACTLTEALLMLADLDGSDVWIQKYAVPTGEAVLRHQVRRSVHPLDGAIAQNSFGRTMVEKYFPYYVARCIPGLLDLHRATGEARFADAALHAGEFVVRSRDRDGGFPQVIYEDGRVNRHPRWVAAVGDVLRTLDLLAPFGLEDDPAVSIEWLMSGFLPTGGIATARGFHLQGKAEGAHGVDLRDVMPVAGWSDKAFRYLASRLPSGQVLAVPPPADAYATEGTFLGRSVSIRVAVDEVTAWTEGELAYRWRSGEDWAEAPMSWTVAR